jgi:hypothetical protein
LFVPMKWTLGIAAAGLVGLAACTDAEEALKKLDGIKADACACHDATCVEDKQIARRMEAWRDDYQAVRGTQAQKDKATALRKEVEACATRAAEGASEDGAAD